jgi:hypothetical protein
MPKLMPASMIFILLCSIGASAFAKRIAPKDVAPLSGDGVEYRFPMTPARLGYVDAYDAKSNKLIWSRQIYVVVRDPGLESDVQDVFITSAKIDGKTLQIVNERKYEYSLDLETLEVKVIKGDLSVKKRR